MAYTQETKDKNDRFEAARDLLNGLVSAACRARNLSTDKRGYVEMIVTSLVGASISVSVDARFAEFWVHIRGPQAGAMSRSFRGDFELHAAEYLAELIAS